MHNRARSFASTWGSKPTRKCHRNSLGYFTVGFEVHTEVPPKVAGPLYVHWPKVEGGFLSLKLFPGVQRDHRPVLAADKQFAIGRRHAIPDGR